MGRLWGIVLAGGVGSRLGGEAVRRYGYARPKQFCDFDGRGTLLQQTLDRTMRLVPEERITVVTTRPWSRREAVESLAPYPRIHQVEQPCGRETGPGILLPLLRVLERDPDALVAVIPSDHHVTRPGAFADALDRAAEAVRDEEARVVLLGAAPDKVEDGLGWIVPAKPGEVCSRVQSFREKPPLPVARRLARDGAMVNTFVMVAQGLDLASLCATRMPRWWRALLSGDPAEIDAAYARLPGVNFSQVVLEASVDDLHVMSLGSVGWNDVGTPERLRRSLADDLVAAK